MWRGVRIVIVESVAVAPVFVAEGPILRWLDPAFLTLAARVQLPAQALTEDWPPAVSTALALRVELERRAEDAEPTDDLWAAVIARTRQPGERGMVWQTLACGLALKELRGADLGFRYGVRHLAERCDIHADLLEGFLVCLREIDTSTPGILTALVKAATSHADKQRKARQREIPTEIDWIPNPTATPGSGPANWTEALAEIADDFTAAGHTLDRLGLELIGRTLIDKQDLADAAADLGLSTEAAYKRRARVEERIAAFYRITARRRAAGRPKAISRGPHHHQDHGQSRDSDRDQNGRDQKDQDATEAGA